MIDISIILQAVLPVYLMMTAGLVLRRLDVFTKEMEPGLLKLVIHLLMPCLILDKVLGNELVRRPDVVGWGIGIGLLLVLIGYLVSWIAAILLGLEKGTGRRTFTLAGGIQNYGYVAIPILMVLFEGGDKVLGLLFLHSLGVEIAIWAFGIMIISGKFLGNPRLLLNGPIVAVVVGVLFSFTGIWQWFEPTETFTPGSTIRQVMSWLGATAFPIGLLMVGATMSDFMAASRPTFKITAGGLIVRLLIMPFLMLVAAKYLPLVTELKQVIIVQAAMPAAVSPVIVARHYGGRPEIAVQVILTTSLAALLTIPLWIQWGIKFVLGN